ncbi:MAG TPA: single-stranded-DNA-specific exonuclease RecJ [Gammaproteobacteria bacterium]|nr:MAG: single-stranded-DNA-specific exonuclease RecJ [OM182 bacterium]HAL42869.1 single-stranded-DNA-specific exonuclease RecJ [Gammaproteobacteria bacterium]|tara:strand:- start:37726 stop:39432 length:1707 start_codon:yes stop_codon:yes gene_type:complete
MQVLVRSVPPASIGSEHPLIDRIYAARGIERPSEADRSLSRLLAPSELPDIEPAANRLADAIEGGERILIVGDFDADGATSVALCVQALTAMGAQDVQFIVPNRFEFGYGLSPEIVALALERAPDLIVTVDNGIASVEGVQAANAAGVDVIITDHHLPGEVLPPALAIVNPNREDSQFSSRAMAGVGVAYYVLSWLRQRLRSRGWFARGVLEEPNMAQYLDLVALGTVADVVPLDHNNRILVHQGLMRMRRGLTSAGIKALAAVGKRDLATLVAQDLGFAVAPRLNAAGRLEDMSIGIRCLMAQDPAAAKALADQLDSLNLSRRELEQDMVADAELILGDLPKDDLSHGISVYHESFHQGVVGIVAGRLREKRHRPAIVFADANDPQQSELKGSARSIDGLNIRDVLDALATRYPGMLIKFGGHAMAAGLTIKRVHYPRFRKAFDAMVADTVTEDALTAAWLTDGTLEHERLTLETAKLIADAGPWGAAFPEPCFRGEFKLISQRIVGGQHLKLVVKAHDLLIDAIAFRQPALSGTPDQVLLVYKLAINDYGGRRTLQLMVEYIEPLS